MAQFARGVSAGIDPECLKRKGVTKDQALDRARAILLQRGTYLLQHVIATIDRGAFKTRLGAAIGTHGVAEFARPANHPKGLAYRAAAHTAPPALNAPFLVHHLETYPVPSGVR